MGILIDEKTKVVVQGMTGKEGQRATKEMLASGISVACGVTPGKGGQEVLDLPVFDSVAEAVAFDSGINTSVLYVPPLMVLDAAMEAMVAGLDMIVIITEFVPVQDSWKLFSYAKEHCVRIVGPSSVGIITVGQGKIGSIASEKEQDMFKPGNVGIISKSGGLCAETSLLLTQNGVGQSTVVGIGGDVIAGSTFVDLMEMFEADSETHAVVLYGEIGGAYELEVAKMITEKRFTKPVVAFIGGRFAESVGKNVALGHAGAIINSGEEGAQAKKKALREAGVVVCDYHHEIADKVKDVLDA